MRETIHKSQHANGGIFTCNRITRGDLAGGYVCDAMINGQYFFMRYLYYTKRECIARFKNELQEKTTGVTLK